MKALSPGDMIIWPNGERATVIWVSSDSKFFRVEGLRTLLRTSDEFEVKPTSNLQVPP